MGQDEGWLMSSLIYIHFPTYTDTQDYSISQTTLDDVFIHFASAQREEVELCNSHEEDKASSHDNTQLPDVVAETSDVEVRCSSQVIISFCTPQ